MSRELSLLTSDFPLSFSLKLLYVILAYIMPKFSIFNPLLPQKLPCLQYANLMKANLSNKNYSSDFKLELFFSGLTLCRKIVSRDTENWSGILTNFPCGHGFNNRNSTSNCVGKP